MESEIQNLFSSVIEKLERDKVPYALAGGLAANLYRNTPRQTKDIDIAISSETSTIQAKDIIESLGLSANEVRQAQLQGGPLFAIKNKTTPIQIIVGRRPEDENTGVDFIMHEMPWVEDAVSRAQGNLMDIGLSKAIPVITREDLILAKLHSFSDKSTRFRDLDDLKELMAEGVKLDIDYLTNKISLLKLKIPEGIKPLCDHRILRVSRKIKKGLHL